jgi:hypothetical protein
MTPKLVIKLSGHITQNVCELEQARNSLNFKGQIVLIDGRRVRNYDELVKVVNEYYPDKESVDVVLLPAMAGG